LGLHQTQSGPGFLVIRGVCSLPGEPPVPELARAWRQYACDVAAAYTVELLEDALVLARKNTARAWIAIACFIAILSLFGGLAAFVASRSLPLPSVASPQPEPLPPSAPASQAPHDASWSLVPAPQPEELPPQSIEPPRLGGSSNSHTLRSNSKSTTTSACMTRDFRVDEWRFEARCICRGVVTRRSMPFTLGEREFALSFENWTCH
jgi:hypothetical protein